MSQNTSMESSPRSPFKASLNPSLRAALGSLDVQLEQELARYRRQRASRRVSTHRSLSRSQTRKPIELISPENRNDSTSLSVSGISGTSVGTTLPGGLLNPTQAATPTPEKTQEQAKALLGSAPSQETPTRPLNPPETPQESADQFVPSPESTSPDDYLESSEQLLRSLAEPETTPQTPKRVRNKLLTPLGLGSILLLLLSSATLTYIILNPSARTSLGLSSWFGESSSPSENSTSVASGTQTPIINGPNLAAEEFPDVNINTLPQLDVSPSPTSSPVAEIPSVSTPPVSQPSPPPVAALPAVPGRVPDLPQAILFPSPKPKPTGSQSKAETSKPPSSTSASQAASAPTQTAAIPKSDGDNFYNVLIRYAGEASLAQARTVVPDAYIRNFPEGTWIQVGAFKLESEAKTLVEQLQQQNLSAVISH